MVGVGRLLLLLLALGAVFAAAPCPDCGAEAGDEALFCPSCGLRLVGRERLLEARDALVAVGSDTDLTVRLPNYGPGLTPLVLPRYRGTGLVISPEGLVLTTIRVIEGGRSFWVRLPGGGERPASLIGLDRPTGVALLQFDAPPGHLPLEREDDELPEMGDAVEALALNSRGERLTTPAVISADGLRRSDLLLIEGSLLFDAVLESAFDGGLLLDEESLPLGMINLHPGPMLERGRALAIPTGRLAEIADRLKREGAYPRPWLGLALSERDDADLEVWFTIPGSPAEDAGIRRGERLLAVDGEPVEDLEDARRVLLAHGIGDVVTLTLEGEDGRRELELRTAALPDEVRPSARDALEFQVGLRVRLEPGGLVVEGVVPGSAAAYDGIQADDTLWFRGIAGADFATEGYRRLNSEAGLEALVESSYLERHFALGLFWGPTRRDGRVLIAPLRAPPVL